MYTIKEKNSKKDFERIQAEAEHWFERFLILGCKIWVL